MNLKNLSEESLERRRGRRRREKFNNNHRKAERNRARDKTLIYNGYSFQEMFSFLMYASLPHILCKTRVGTDSGIF